MTNGTANAITYSVAAMTTLRVLIASYFLAVALEIIPGTDLGILFESMLPATVADATSAGLVFIFSFMIMIGLATRVAALMIALMTVLASYLWMLESGMASELGTFWRDIALIAALLLTYGEVGLNGSQRHRKLIRRVVAPRRVVLPQAARPAQAHSPRAVAAKPAPRPLEPEIDNIFAL